MRSADYTCLRRRCHRRRSPSFRASRRPRSRAFQLPTTTDDRSWTRRLRPFAANRDATALSRAFRASSARSSESLKRHTYPEAIRVIATPGRWEGKASQMDAIWSIFNDRSDDRWKIVSWRFVEILYTRYFNDTRLCSS